MNDLFDKAKLDLTLYCLMSTKRLHILKQTCSWKLKVCLSMCDLSVDIRHLRVIRCIIGVTFWIFLRSWLAEDSSVSIVLGDSGDLWTLSTLSGPLFLLLSGGMGLIKNEAFLPFFFCKYNHQFLIYPYNLRWVHIRYLALRKIS